MRTFLILALIITGATLFASVSQASDFRLYPGFRDKDAFVEMTHDKGLIVEITLRCGIDAKGRVQPGIMTYSKIERLYCSSQNRCYRDALKAADQTCG